MYTTRGALRYEVELSIIGDRCIFFELGTEDELIGFWSLLKVSDSDNAVERSDTDCESDSDSESDRVVGRVIFLARILEEVEEDFEEAFRIFSSWAMIGEKKDERKYKLCSPEKG